MSTNGSNGNGHHQPPPNGQPVVTPELMQAIKAGQLHGPVLHVCGAKSEHRTLVIPLPMHRDAAIFTFAQAKGLLADLLHKEAELDAQAHKAEVASNIIIPQIDMRNLKLPGRPGA